MRPPTARAREQRVIRWGLAIVLVAIVATRVVVPYTQRWQARAVALEAARERVAQRRAIAAQAPQLTQAADVAERQLASAARRVLHARSLALAASALQALLQDATDGAGMVVNRIEAGADVGVDSEAESEASAAAGPRAAAPAVSVPGDAVTASLSVIGDIHGLAALLATLERGPRVVVVERLTVTQNSALRGASDVLQVTIGVRAPVVLE